MSNNNSYIEKRNSIIKDVLFDGYSLDLDELLFIKDRLTKRKPLTKEHFRARGYMDKFDSEKDYDKFISTLLKVEDINFKEDLINTNKINFFKSIGQQESLRLLNAIAARKISGHNLLSNFPRTIKYEQDFVQLLYRVLKLKLDDNDVFKIISYGNYRRVLDSKNKNELKNQVDMLETTKKLYNSNAKISNPEMLLKDLDCGDFLRFSKDSVKITGIGSSTLCCFKKGGVGEPLMNISLKSPIAAIIYGERAKTTWFAYVWEMLEFNKERNTFEINLILDNIESNNLLSEEDYYFISDSLKEYDKYAKIYLGYLRNDIKVPNDIISTKHLKPYTIPFYNKEVNSYSVYDDSKYIYTMIEREDLDKDNYKIEKVSLGHFHRIKYILDYVKEMEKDKEKPKASIFLNKESKAYKLKIDRNTKLKKYIDFEKSYILLNSYDIKHFVLYDTDGNIFAQFN